MIIEDYTRQGNRKRYLTIKELGLLIADLIESNEIIEFMATPFYYNVEIKELKKYPDTFCELTEEVFSIQKIGEDESREERRNEDMVAEFESDIKTLSKEKTERFKKNSKYVKTHEEYKEILLKWREQLLEDIVIYTNKVTSQYEGITKELGFIHFEVLELGDL